LPGRRQGSGGSGFAAPPLPYDWRGAVTWRYPPPLAPVTRRSPAINPQETTVPALLPQPDPDGLLEYSVVYTDRALNHMSKRFQGVMKDIARILRTVYNGSTAIVVPGSGTFGMEAVARQFATDRKCLVIRNGWFSFRWTQIFEMGRIPAACIVMKARQLAEGAQAPFAPPPIDDVVACIHARKAGGRFCAARRDCLGDDSAQRLPACRG
jgi:hypothetical protein